MDERTASEPARVAVVTGAARGIGKAVAARLEADGFAVVRTDLRPHGVDEGVAFLDVSDPASWRTFASDLAGRFGRIDVLVNNAGTSAPASLMTVSESDWTRITETIVGGTWRGTQHLAPLIAPGGSIVNLGSVYGSRLPPLSDAFPVSPAYQVAKAGVHRLTVIAAQELAPSGIRVNAVAPGFIETDLVSSLAQEVAQRRRSGAFLGRSGTVEEVADAISFLVSERASFITGEVLTVGGGYHDEYSPA